MTALSAMARRVLEARYLRRDAQGRVIETPEELVARVARATAQAELLLGTARQADLWQERFAALLGSLDFLPNSPALMNAGTPLGQLCACFVLPIEDSLEAIFDALRAMALVQRSGGGTGFAFSRLRPRDDLLGSTGGRASGPVSFMRVFDAATENIKLGGRRRGANMAVLRIDHPDIEEFVTVKCDGRSLQNFNLSVGVTDAFMDAVTVGGMHELIHPSTQRVVGRVRARQLFDRLVQAAWTSGDPGLLFLDAVARADPLPSLGPIEATNPCGEVPLRPFGSCVLGSVNLAHMLRGPEGQEEIDWERLRATVHAGVRFLDDLLEVTREPLPEIAAVTRASRSIGLGVMGFAELLLRLGVSYADEAAVIWADRVAGFVAEEARQASRRLAEERGVFPAWEQSRHGARGDRLRNATCCSIAPTGTLSLIAGTSASIEPLFALVYRREHTLGGPPFVETNPIFLRAVASLGIAGEALLAHVRAHGTLDGAPVDPALARRFATALTVSPAQHLRVQQAFQRHVDNAVSKTVNLPAAATPSDVATVYLDAWRLGLKGVTVYRYGSAPGQVLTLGAEEEPAARELFARCDPAACRL